MVNPLIFRNTIHGAKQRGRSDTSFVIRCIVGVRFFNYLTKFYSPFIKLPSPTCRDYHPQTSWELRWPRMGAAAQAHAAAAPGPWVPSGQCPWAVEVEPWNSLPWSSPAGTIGLSGMAASGLAQHPLSDLGKTLCLLAPALPYGMRLLRQRVEASAQPRHHLVGGEGMLMGWTQGSRGW